MPVTDFPVFCSFDRQRFVQFGSEDCANWYICPAEGGKNGVALHPGMGRKHFQFGGANQFVFDVEPRALFRSVNYAYFVVGNRVIRVDRFFNQLEVQNADFSAEESPVWFTYLRVGLLTFCVFTSARKLFVLEESAGTPMVTMDLSAAPTLTAPTFIASFGGRIAVSDAESNQWYISQSGLGGSGWSASSFFNVVPLNVFASGTVRQFGVLQNQLYVFCDFTTDIWVNTATQIGERVFPWRLNTNFNFNYGLLDPNTLSIDFGRMVWLARNSAGMAQFMVSDGGVPTNLDTQAIDVLLERSTFDNELSPFLQGNTKGFLYQFENSIFYRVSSGTYDDTKLLEIEEPADCIEYNFNASSWARCTELNGQRNRIQRHVFFNNRHLVTVQNDGCVYEMSGDIYFNEHRNPDQPDPQAQDAFIKEPMRYTLTTPQIHDAETGAEFVTEWLQIDMVFGDNSFIKFEQPYSNAEFIVTEESTEDDVEFIVTEDSTESDPELIVAEGSNYETFESNHYWNFFKPSVELWVSDDGGVTFWSAANREFSPLGAYQWRMRWYELGASRNRVYKLVCVASCPMVILGGKHLIKIVSGGAY